MVVDFIRRSTACVVVSTIGALALVVPMSVVCGRLANAQTIPSVTVAAHASTNLENQARVSIDAENQSLRVVLDDIARQAGLRPSYNPALVPATARVTLHAKSIPVTEAFERVLRNTGLVAQIQVTGNVLLVRAAAADFANGTIVGIVTDAKTKQPLRGVTIMVEGTKRSAVTDENGRFRLVDLPPGTYQLTARRLGYARYALSVTVGDGETLSRGIALEGNVATELTEVITTGAGDRTKLEVGNAISTINADSIVQNTPIRTLSDLLNGRAAGLDVLPASGSAGAGSKIRIRGLSSLMSSEDPVVIVDGIRFDDAYTRARGTGYGIPTLNAAAAYVPASSRLDDIDPKSIESIDVLKGPAASALYGSDAANGVIVVKTKHGRPGPNRWVWSAEQSRSTQNATYPEPYYGWGTQYGVIPYPSTCALANVAALTCKQDSITHYNP
jgi:TonB-dependent SusC/RagA subfamily outer membrane receptor